jgi:hypothetical protein
VKTTFVSCLVKTSEVMSNFDRTWAGTALPSETATGKLLFIFDSCYVRASFSTLDSYYVQK